MSKDSLQSKKDEANRLVAEIISQSEVIEQKLNESVIHLNDSIKQSTDARKHNTTLSKTIKDINVTIEKFRKERKTITRLLYEVNRFYDKKYLPLTVKIEDRNTGLQARLNSSKKESEEIVKLRNLSVFQYNEVKNYVTDLKKKNRELTTIDTQIRKLSESTKINSDNVQSIERVIFTVNDKIKKLNHEIQTFFDTSKDNNSKIKLLLEQSNSSFKIINDNGNESIKILEEIKKIYGLAAETGLSGEFERQKIKLSEQLIKWEKRIFYTSLSLLSVIIILFIFELKLYDWKLKNIDVNFYLRFILFSPIVYYLFFCANQFSQAKKLHVKYTFKTTLAMSIQNHIKMLLDEEKFNQNAREKILEFVLDGFQKIYTEPYADDDFKLGLKINNIEMDIEKKMVEKFNELKNLIKK